MERSRVPWFLLGFIAVALGNAIGAVYMFRGNVPAVMVGVFSMVSGFQVMHYGVHGEGMVTIFSDGEERTEKHGSLFAWARTLVLLVLCIYFISQGFVIGSVATRESFTMLDMGACGSLIVLGYITGHMSVHGEVL